MATTETTLQHQDALQRVRAMAEEFAQTYPIRDKQREFPHEEMAKLKKSGLLTLPVPKEYGGMDMPFGDLIEVIMTVAEGNPSIAQMYGGHLIMVAETIPAFAPEALQKRLYKQIVENQVFVANASSEKQSKNIIAWETTFTPTPANDGILIKGKKFFSTGSLASELLFVPGMLNNEIAVAFVPTNAPGLTIHNDWNSMGQRGTSSGTSEFNNVHVPWDWIIPKMGSLQEPDATDFFGPVVQAMFASIYVGTAKAAFKHALEYVKTKTRPWIFGGVTSALEDPYILQELGKMRAYLSAAESLVRQAALAVEQAMAQRGKVSGDELMRHRGEAMVEVAEAKVMATEVALRVCLDIFKVCGTRSALAEEDFDRFLRDVRTLTLHDPVEYKAKMIGEYFVQGRLPFPSLVS